MTRRPGQNHPALMFFLFLGLSLTCFTVLIWGAITEHPWVLVALPLMYVPYWYYKALPPAA